MFTRFGKRMVGPFMDADTGATGGGEAGNIAPAASGGGEPAAVPAPAAPAAPVNPLLSASLFRESPAAEAAPVVPEPATPVVPEVRKLNFGGREVPVVDPIVEDIHRDYTELTRTFTQTNQAYKQLESQNAQLQTMLQTFQAMAQQQQPAAQQAQAPAAPTPEELEAKKEAFMEKFYEDPQAAVQEMAMQLIEQKVNPVITPIQKEQEFKAEATRLSRTYEDFGQVVPAMQQLVAAMPDLENLGLEKVYHLAKTMNASAAPTQPQAEPVITPTPPATQATQTPDDIKAQLMNDPEFKNQLFAQMLQERQQQQAAIPPVIGNQAGGSIPTMPENKPKSIRDGSKALLRHFGL